MKFTTPIPFAEALEKLRERKILPTALGTAELALIPVELRERAFFSAKVESARLLQSMKDYTDDFLGGVRMENGGFKATGRAEFVADMRELAIREGLGKIDPATGEINPNIAESDLTDIRSISRLELIFDTITEQAQEYGYFVQGQDPAILDVFPAQRFIRIRPVSAPRSYHAANEGAVKRKDDTAFWLSMNRDFGVPWGPWGFNSGMGVEDVDREEAIALGVMKESDTVKPVKRKFNEGLEASTRGLDGGILAALARSTGGEISNSKIRLPKGEGKERNHTRKMTMKNKGTLKISIAREDGGTIVYQGEAAWRTDRVPMRRVSGRPLEGYDETRDGDLEYHAAMIRSAALAGGMDTVEEWDDEGFQGGRER